jgi:hypothetical protein
VRNLKLSCYIRAVCRKGHTLTEGTACSAINERLRIVKTRQVRKWVNKDSDNNNSIYSLQKAAILGTSHIIRVVVPKEN